VDSKSADHDRFRSENGLCFGICFIPDLKIKALFSSTGFKFCHICRFLLLSKEKMPFQYNPSRPMKFKFH
jgi:hypothetical protein